MNQITILISIIFCSACVSQQRKEFNDGLFLRTKFRLSNQLRFVIINIVYLPNLIMVKNKSTQQNNAKNNTL